MSFKPNALLLLTALAAALSLAGNILQYRAHLSTTARLNALAAAGSQDRIVERYIHDSVEHVVVREVQAKTSGEKALAVGAGYLDTVTQALRVAVRQIDEITQVNATLNAQNLQLRQSAGAPAARQEYQDKYLTLTYDRDSNAVNLQYNVALQHARYWKRPGFLAAKRYYNDLWCDDSRVTIGSVKRFTLPEAVPSRWSIGAAAGVGFAPGAGWIPYAGLGVSYALIRF